MTKTNDGSTSRVSGASERTDDLPGKVYFIRHGESTSNERNIFAGILDVGLTAFGKLQARRAGMDIKKKGIKFDAVYVSHMRRAQQTCELALEVSQGQASADTPVQIDHRIGEKSFGIFAGRNINLVRLALGYEAFEEMLHSHNETPPAGEKMAQVYARAASFYEEKVVPHLKRGENVLVVSHGYVLEALALYLSDLPATDYKTLKLSNAKALSKEDLVNFRKKESSDSASLRKQINDLTTMWGIFLYAIAFLIGGLLKVVSSFAPGIPANLFTVIIVSCLAISTFYTYLDIDFAGTRGKVSKSVKAVVKSWMLVRWTVGLLLIFSGVLYQNTVDLYKVLWVLFWMVPPALTSPVLSVLWGGNLYPSAVIALATGFQFTPATLISDIFFPTDTNRALACLQQLGFAILVFALMRGLAVLTLVFSQHWISKAEAQDAYILLVNPNFFLWAALFSGVSTTANIDALKYTAFWAALGFFCIPLGEQVLFMASFTNEMLQETMRSSRMATEDIKKLFTQLDTDGSKALEKAEIIELLGLIEDLTTGERSSQEARSYIADYLFNTLDADKNGSVDLQELEDYLSTYGLVANLNV